VVQQLILNGLIAGSIYALIALGFALIYGTTRFFHFVRPVINSYQLSVIGYQWSFVGFW